MKNRTRQTGEWSVICTRPTLLTLAWASGRALMSNPDLLVQWSCFDWQHNYITFYSSIFDDIIISQNQLKTRLREFGENFGGGGAYCCRRLCLLVPPEFSTNLLARKPKHYLTKLSFMFLLLIIFPVLLRLRAGNQILNSQLASVNDCLVLKRFIGCTLTWKKLALETRLAMKIPFWMAWQKL